nr:antizyme inhibitor 2-like [Procambarus clarkii]
MAAKNVCRGSSVMEAARDIAGQPGREEAFYILDVDEVVRRLKLWRQLLPRVELFYAVKCNNDPGLLEALVALGAGFDCASKAELEQVLGLGAHPRRIIFANPYKAPSHIRRAQELNVPLMTFDSVSELHKVKAIYPEAQLVLRIRSDATEAIVRLGLKFGALPEETRELLVAARTLSLNIVGVAFHVGSGCRESTAYTRAITAARKVFDEAEEEGFKPYLLNIGGGFPGQDDVLLTKHADCINKALNHFFPDDGRVEVISEPGRYVATKCFTLVTTIIGKRRVVVEGQVHPTSNCQGQVHPTSNSQGQVHPTSNSQGQVHPTSNSQGQVHPTSNSQGQVGVQVSGPPTTSGQEQTGTQESEHPATVMYYINEGTYSSFALTRTHFVPDPPTPLEVRGETPVKPSIVWGRSCCGNDRVTKKVFLLPDLQLGDWLMWPNMGAYCFTLSTHFNGFPLTEVHVVASSDTVDYMEGKMRSRQNQSPLPDHQ